MRGEGGGQEEIVVVLVLVRAPRAGSENKNEGGRRLASIPPATCPRPASDPLLTHQRLVCNCICRRNCSLRFARFKPKLFFALRAECSCWQGAVNLGVHLFLHASLKLSQFVSPCFARNVSFGQGAVSLGMRSIKNKTAAIKKIGVSAMASSVVVVDAVVVVVVPVLVLVDAVVVEIIVVVAHIVANIVATIVANIVANIVVTVAVKIVVCIVADTVLDVVVEIGAVADCCLVIKPCSKRNNRL